MHKSTIMSLFSPYHHRDGRSVVQVEDVMYKLLQKIKFGQTKRQHNFRGFVAKLLI